MINDVSELRALYGEPKGRTLSKELKQLEKHSRHFIACSPFVVISSVGARGDLDASPRGGKPGFVKVLSDTRIVIPEAKGNKRLDNLCNIVETGKIGSLFFIPGIDETLRVNGSATISTDPELLALFSDEVNAPLSVIDVQVEAMYLHCAKALMRSQLWSADAQINPEEFPTMGRMLNDQAQLNGPEESREAMRARYLPDL